MKQNILLTIVMLSFILSCQKQEVKEEKTSELNKQNWHLDSLNEKALQHLDTSRRDHQLFKQDVENYEKFGDYYKSLPLNKSPFPVAVYDYAVSGFPFVIQRDSTIFKGIKIGEYKDPESDVITEKLTLFILTNDINSVETYLVESRNFPYLTAEGDFKVSNNSYDWVFSASPDGFSVLLVNMKLFDLRFGETIIIYPQIDKTFLYDQIKDSPNNYKNFEDYKKVIINNNRVQKQLLSENNIK